MKTTQDLKRLNRHFSGIYRAIVENNIDPLEGLRIQARVHPMMFGTDFAIADIPWAKPCFPLLTGAESGGGWQVVPDIGSHVWVMFEGGDIRKPVYLGEAFRATLKHTEKDTVRKRVFRFKSGIVITVDDDNTWLRVDHPTGTYMLIDTDGKVRVHATKSITLDNINDHIYVTPDDTHQAIIKDFSHIVKAHAGGNVTPEHGGVITYSGALTFTLPDPATYPGLVFLFVRTDAGVSPATITNQVGIPGYVNQTGQWSTVRVTSCGLRWVTG